MGGRWVAAVVGRSRRGQPGWLSFDNTQATPQTTINVQRFQVELAGSMPGKIEVVALATEDEALRIGAALSTENPENSLRVERTAPAVGGRIA